EILCPVVAHDEVFGIGPERTDLQGHPGNAAEAVALDHDVPSATAVVVEGEIDALAAAGEVVAGDGRAVQPPPRDDAARNAAEVIVDDQRLGCAVEPDRGFAAPEGAVADGDGAGLRDIDAAAVESKTADHGAGATDDQVADQSGTAWRVERHLRRDLEIGDPIGARGDVDDGARLRPPDRLFDPARIPRRAAERKAADHDEQDEQPCRGERRSHGWSGRGARSTSSAG